MKLFPSSFLESSNYHIPSIPYLCLYLSGLHFHYKINAVLWFLPSCLYRSSGKKWSFGDFFFHSMIFMCRFSWSIFDKRNLFVAVYIWLFISLDNGKNFQLSCGGKLPSENISFFTNKSYYSFHFLNTPNTFANILVDFLLSSVHQPVSTLPYTEKKKHLHFCSNLRRW